MLIFVSHVFFSTYVFVRKTGFAFVFNIILKRCVPIKAQPFSHYLIERYLFKYVAVTPECMPDKDVIKGYELFCLFVKYLVIHDEYKEVKKSVKCDTYHKCEHSKRTGLTIPDPGRPTAMI